MIRKLKDQKYAKIALTEAVSLLALETDMTFKSCWNKVKRNVDKIYKKAKLAEPPTKTNN